MYKRTATVPKSFLSDLEDRVEVVLLKCLWAFVFALAVVFNVFVKVTGWNPGSAPTSATKSGAVDEDTSSTSSWLRNKYNFTALVYDFCDMPWERIYRTLRPKFVGDLSGKCLDLGVGTGRNLPFFAPDAKVTGVDISHQMIAKAKARAHEPEIVCTIDALVVADATDMRGKIADNSFDAVTASFLFCVLPDALQRPAIEEVHRVLKPGGTFRIIELMQSQNPKQRWYQDMFAPFVEFMYGARFDTKGITKLSIAQVPGLTLDSVEFLNGGDVMLLLQGRKKA